MGISTVPAATASLLTIARPATLSLLPRATLRISKYTGQTRSFRLGSWLVSEDSRHLREPKRRYRTPKEKYMESLSKRLSWDRYFPVAQKQAGLKSFMCSTWRAQERAPGQHWYHEDRKIKNSNSRDQEKSINEVDSTPSDKSRGYTHPRSMIWNTRSRAFRDGWSSCFVSASLYGMPQRSSFTSQEDSKRSEDHPARSRAVDHEVDSEIDPITNRRVVKNTSGDRKHATSKSPSDALDPSSASGSENQKAKPTNAEIVNNSRGDGQDTLDGGKTYETRGTYSPTESSIDYSDPDQTGLKSFDEKVATKPLDLCGVEPLERHHQSVQRDPQGVLKEIENFNTPLDPVAAAIQEYEAHEEHPEIPQQVRDQQVEARQNARRAAAKLEDTVISQDLSDGQQSKTAQAEDLLETIQEYNCCPEHNPATPIQEELVAYDKKADYDPKHLIDLPVKHTDYAGCDDATLAGDLKSDKLDSVPSWKSARGISSNQQFVPGIRTRRELEEDFERLNSLSLDEETLAINKVRITPKLIQDLQIETSELRNHVAHARGRIEAKLAEVEAGWEKPKESKKMTGNFVRDFPEEFKKSWSHTSSDSECLTPKASSDRQVEAEVQEREKHYVNGLASREAFARTADTPRLETALDRVTSGRAASRRDVASVKENHKNLVREVRKIYEESYGTINSKHRQIPQADKNESTRLPEVGDVANQSIPTPTLYKILAYDPTMQSISTAETTSIVPDSAAPLTPAEVLLRLSNPAKFFPHFQPLQAEGFEIISGSGDVLIFRKVRSSSAAIAPNGPVSAVQERMRSTNPIDGMACPTADFASPTGFVNHDIDRGVTKPPFKSNIDVRREEPVFSGKPNWKDKEQGRKPRHVGRRILIGAAWVAACSYAVGVVLDFFKTGGMDGLGLQGF